MKQWFTCVCLLGFFVSSGQPAIEKYTSDTLYNAFQVSKEALKFERKILTPGESLSVEDTLKIKSIVASIIWYANLQDLNQNEQIPALPDVLKPYTRLLQCYQTLYTHLLRIDAFFSIPAGQIDNFLNSYEFPDGAAKAVLKPLLQELENANKEDSLKSVAYKTAYAQYMDGNSAKLNLENRLSVDTDSLKSKRAAAMADVLTFLSDSTETSIRLQDSRNRLTVLFTAQQNAGEAFANAKTRVLEAKRVLEAYLKRPDLPPATRELLAKISHIGNGSFTLTDRENQIAAAVSTIQSVKETVIQESAGISTSLRLPSQSEIIDAIAIYLARRVKQEAVMWFFETLQRNAKQYELIKTFFPNTITLLLSNEVFEIPNLGAQWRYALSKDFITMPRNVLTSSWFKKWFKTDKPENQQAYRFLMAAVDIGDLLNQRYNYRELVKQMYLQLSSGKPEETGAGIFPVDVFSMLYAFNQECFVRINKDSLRLMRYEDIRGITKDELEMAAGLMDVKYGHAINKFWPRTGPTSEFRFLATETDQFRRWIGSIESGVRQFEKIQQDYLKLVSAAKDLQVADAVYSSFNIWDNVNGLFNVLIPDTSMAPACMRMNAERFIKVRKYTTDAFDIYHQLSLKNYAGAVNTSIGLIEELLYAAPDSSYRLPAVNIRNVFHDSIPKIFKKAHNPFLKVDSAGMYYKFKQTDQRAALVFNQDRNAIKLIRKLAGFLNDVMLTTDSKKLAKVVESYALPPGSYKRKRNTWWSLDVNAFVGAYVGYETANKQTGVHAPKLRSDGYVYGITAPIGISLSKTLGSEMAKNEKLSEDLIRNPDKIRLGGKRIWKRSQTTLTLTGNIVDIGAVVSFRFNNTQDSILPQKINWAQVFSPGLHLAIGLRNTPLVFGVGYQYTPRLRKIGDVIDTDSRQYNTGRFSASLLFDLPLINLWQRTYWSPRN